MVKKYKTLISVFSFLYLMKCKFADKFMNKNFIHFLNTDIFFTVIVST